MFHGVIKKTTLTVFLRHDADMI